MLSVFLLFKHKNQCAQTRVCTCHSHNPDFHNKVWKLKSVNFLLFPRVQAARLVIFNFRSLTGRPRRLKSRAHRDQVWLFNSQIATCEIGQNAVFAVSSGWIVSRHRCGLHPVDFLLFETLGFWNRHCACRRKRPTCRKQHPRQRHGAELHQKQLPFRPVGAVLRQWHGELQHDNHPCHGPQTERQKSSSG